METSKEQEIIQHLININLALQQPHSKFEDYVSQLSSKALGLSKYIDSISNNFRDLIARLGALTQETMIGESLHAISMGSKEMIQIEKNIYHFLSVHENRVKESVKELDIGQALSEIKYIGNRLKSIEERLAQIEKSGIRSDVIVTVSQNERPIPVAEKSDKQEEIINTLTDRESKVIFMRYGLSGESSKTYCYIGKTLSISTERVRQIEKKALRRLRQRISMKLYSERDFPKGKLKEAIFGKGDV